MYKMNVDEEELSEMIQIVWYCDTDPLFEMEACYTPRCQNSKVCFDKWLSVTRVERCQCYS